MAGLIQKVGKSSLKAPSLHAAVLCAAVFCLKILRSDRVCTHIGLRTYHQIERMIQSNARNSILRIYGGSNLAQAGTINFRLFWRTKGQNFFAFLFNHKQCIWIHCKAWSNLTQEIEFLEFMGGFNSTHAHSIFLNCTILFVLHGAYPGEVGQALRSAWKYYIPFLGMRKVHGDLQRLNK